MEFINKNITIIIMVLFLILVICLQYKKKSIKTKHYSRKINNDFIPTISKFYASYCSHCKTFEQPWNEFKRKMHGKNIKILEYQCDGKDADICNKSDIAGYPTVKLNLGNNLVIDYHGNRTANDLIDFCNKNIKNL